MEQFEEEPTSIMFRSPGLTAFSASSPRRGEGHTLGLSPSLTDRDRQRRKRERERERAA